MDENQIKHHHTYVSAYVGEDRREKLLQLAKARRTTVSCMVRILIDQEVQKLQAAQNGNINP